MQLFNHKRADAIATALFAAYLIGTGVVAVTMVSAVCTPVRAQTTEEMRNAILGGIKGVPPHNVLGTPPQQATEPPRLWLNPQTPPPEELQPITKTQATVAGAFGVRDIPQIAETSRSNDIRFNRDYRGKTFAAVLPLGTIRENIFMKGKYQVEFDTATGGNVNCRVSDPALIDRMANWNKGQIIKLTGIIGGTVMGNVQLDNCEMTPSPR